MFPPSFKPWARRVAGLVLAVLALWALAWLAVPPLLRSQGERLASEALGRKVTIGRVEFAPWSLVLTVHQLAIATADGKQVQLAVERLRVDADIESLWRRAPVIDALEIDAPVLHLAQTEAGRYDIDDILERFAKPEADQTPNQEPQRFALYNLTLRGGAVDLEDRTVQHTHTLRDVQLSVPFLSTLASQREIKVKPHLAFKLNGSAFDSTAEATPFLDNRKSEVRLRLSGLDLGSFASYIPANLPVRLQAGVLDLDMTLAFEQTAKTSIHLRGELKTHGLRLSNPHKQPVLDLESLDVQVADLQPLEKQVRLASVVAVVNDLALGAGGLGPLPPASPRLQGRLEADLDLAWPNAAAKVQVERLQLDGLALTCPSQASCAGAGLPGIAMRDKNSLAELKVLRVEQLHVDQAQRLVQIGRMAFTQPRAMVERDAQGRWMLEQWMPAAPSSPAAAASGPPWNVQWGALEVDGGAVALRDALPAKPVALGVSSLRLRLTDLALQGTQPASIAVSARIGAGRTEPGRLEYEGTLNLAKLGTEGKLTAQQLPLHALEPYVAQALNVRVLRADGGFQGKVQVASAPEGLTAQVRGDAALDDLRVRSALLTQAAGSAAPEGARQLAVQDDLLRWKSLGLRGLDLALAPGKPTRLTVRETALSDFFARIIVQESGRINLQDVLRDAAGDQAELAHPAGPQSDASSAEPSRGEKTQLAAAPSQAPIVRFGPVSLTGGTVRFSDYFIKPNYTADLSELAGRISAFSSEPPAEGGAVALADLELRGRAEGTASLEITGQVNPLARPLAMDIVGKMRDLELPPLSPYSVKYAGHGIERGKLSMDVAYKIQPDGQLTASNKLVLKQLTFGEPVEGAPASMPVRLATALLADRNGVIDLDLPISGSLNDPQFRLGPVIFKIIGNLIMKAVTAPFALLTSALGGSADLSTVAFAPGSAQLDDAARQGLDKVAKALTDRPALRMTVVGEALGANEREGWKKAQLQKLLAAQKRRQAVRAGKDAEGVAPVTAEEAPALLKEVYLRADIPKPRNLVGMAKDIPLAEMESLMLASIAVPEGAMRELAVARGVAVRDYLTAHQVPNDRLFLGAVNTQPADKDWAPRAQLTLAAQ